MTDETLAPAEGSEPREPSPGQILADARNAKGLSVIEVARSLRLSTRQIEAIEADDFDKLPGMTFMRGFVRNYAKLLQLDPEPLLEACRRSATSSSAQVISVPPGQGEFTSSRSQRTFSGNHEKSRALRILPVLLVVIALLGWAVYEVMHGAANQTVVVKPAGDSSAVVLPLPPVGQPESSVVPSDVAPVALVTETPAPASSVKEVTSTATSAPKPAEAPTASGAGSLRLLFSGESWVEVKDKTNRTIFKQTGYAGNEQIISGTPPFALTIGRATHVKVFYNDKPVTVSAGAASGDVARLTLN